MASHDPANAGRHDIVIVGGGLVGASLALALERSGLDVAMVEATPVARLPEVFDPKAKPSDERFRPADAVKRAESAASVSRTSCHSTSGQSRILESPRARSPVWPMW